MMDGKDFSRPTDDELTAFRREYMGFVFQSYNLMPNLTAQENTQFIADIAKNPMPVEDAVRRVGLEERADNYPSIAERPPCWNSCTRRVATTTAF